jgi:F-type H+-transporting ATPase subunit epsilon
MLTLEVITPTGKVLSAEVESVTAPGVKGQFQVLDQHRPLLSILGSGSLRYAGAKESGELLIRGGVAEVNAEGKVLILTDEVQTLDALDREHAQKIKAEAEAGFNNGYSDDAELDRLQHDLVFAEAVLSR